MIVSALSVWLWTFLIPIGPVAWIARVLVWCLCGSAVHFAVKTAFGLPVDPIWDTVLISLTLIPLLSAGFILGRLQNAHLEKMTRAALTDSLTGLMNRRAFLPKLEQAGNGALLVIDVDHFKAINDRFGHAVGDKVLEAMTAHLNRNVRTSDIVARVGGEEFAVFLQDCDSLEVDKIGARLCRGFVLYNEAVTTPVKVTMSIGAAYSAMSANVDELFKNADEALYAAKNSGRARLNFWQPVTSGRS